MIKTISLFIFSLFAFQLSGQCWDTVACGLEFSLAMKSNKTLWAWGRNSNGQLGDGTFTDRYAPVQIGNDSDWVVISAGAAHAIAVKSDGSLWAWGDNSFAQCGDSTWVDKKVPTNIGNAGWKWVSAGDMHSMGIKTDGTLWGWGDNLKEQVGYNLPSTLFRPTQASTENKWKMVSAGGEHSIGLKTNGTAWGWGNQSWGGAVGCWGNGNSPCQIGTDTNWVFLEAGGAHSLGIKADSSLWAWGKNGGALGDNTYGDQYTPVHCDPHYDNWKWVAASWGNSFGIRTDGTAWGWGANDGRLGNGTTIPATLNYPFQIGTKNNWKVIAGGGYHSIGLQDANLLSWGNTTHGQLGNGSAITNSFVISPILPVSTCIVVDVMETEYNNLSFEVYPNPAQDKLILRNESSERVNKIFVIDGLGKRTMEMQDAAFVIDIAHLEVGLYQLVIVCKNQCYVYKFFKQ